MDQMPMDNEFQLAFVDLLLEILNLMLNLFGNVILPGILSVLLEALFGGTPTSM